MGAWVLEWAGNSAMALIAVLAVSVTVRFTVQWIADPEPDHEGRMCPTVDALLTATAETQPIVGGGR